MMFLEMSRDEGHGGGSWAFPNCVWAPTQKKRGGKWPFWTKVGDIREGDIVLHLRGISPNAEFVGYSRASGDGFVTSRRPPDPKAWSYSNQFYRADLEGFTRFHEPINLRHVFEARRKELDNYFKNNKKKGAQKLNVFYVRQAGRLQCLNGAYLSDVDEELFNALFGPSESIGEKDGVRGLASIATGSQLATVRARLGQSRFSKEIKTLYGGKCCFPGCDVSDSRFLVGSHIARWSDNEELRGNLGNGLCLCLVHDKAFEVGVFTLDESFRVYVNPREKENDSTVVIAIAARNGEQIRLADVKPLDDALLEHWIRVDIAP
jgi:hypothetical protein